MKENRTPLHTKLLSIFVLTLTCTAIFSLPSAHASFAGVFDGTTLTLTQTADDGNVTIDNNGAGNAFRATDGSGTTTFVAATNLIVTLLDSTGNTLDLDLDSAVAGSVTLNLGNGTRAVNFTGISNSMGAALTINGGTGDQTIEVAVNANLVVGGSLTANLGSGFDVIDEDNNNISITVDMDFIGVNFFENGGVFTVGGNVTVDPSAEIEDTLFDDDNEMNIVGNFDYIGGSGRDEITMNGVGAGTSIGGDATVNVADNTVGGVQFIFFNLPNSSIDGNLVVTSTASTNIDVFSTHPAFTLGGNLSVDLGDGPNDASFTGTYSGSVGEYQGGSGVDTVFLDATAPGMDFEVYLRESVDTFTLGASTSLASLLVRFGCGNQDVFNDQLGEPYPFPTTILSCSATFDISKVFTDSTVADVGYALDCSDDSFDQAGSISSGDSPGTTIDLVDFQYGMTCTVTETDVDAGYYLQDQTGCGPDVLIEDEGSESCLFTNSSTEVRFHVTKTFSDGSDFEVDVEINCNDGLPSSDSAMVTGGDPAGHTFVVEAFADGEMDCEITESGGPDGYDPSPSCVFEDVTSATGTYECAFGNEALPGEYTVTKEWVIANEGGDFIREDVRVTIACDRQIFNKGAEQIKGTWFLSRRLGDGESMTASVRTERRPNRCMAEENINQSGVESESEGSCDWHEIGAGESSYCTFINTVFFEGIPTLSQYGLALLALLMLGVGMVGFRRYV